MKTNSYTPDTSGVFSDSVYGFDAACCLGISIRFNGNNYLYLYTFFSRMCRFFYQYDLPLRIGPDIGRRPKENPRLFSTSMKLAGVKFLLSL